MLTIPSTLLPALRNALGAIAGAKGGTLTVSPSGTDKAGNRLIRVTGEREVTYSALPLSGDAAGVVLTMMGIELGGMLAGVGKDEAGKWESLWHEAKEDLAEMTADRDALQRTVGKLRQELEKKNNQALPYVLTFPAGQQGRVLKAAGLDVAKLKASGFVWQFTDRADPSQGGHWEAKPTIEATPIYHAVVALL